MDEGLICEPLFEDDRLAVLSAGHPLAALDVLDPYELAQEPYVWVRDVDPVSGAFWTLEDYRRGAQRKIGAHITGFEDMFAAVRAGQAVSTIPASVATGLPWPDIVVRPVADLPPATVALCRRADDTRPIVSAFAEVVRTAPPT
jgi:DNA-binding transcriptional LysR family regulator